MKDLIGRKVTQIVELLVERDTEVFGEVLKETKFKTGNRSVTVKSEGLITNASDNSVEVFMNKVTDKGVNCYSWFEKGKFERTFSILNEVGNVNFEKYDMSWNRNTNSKW
jgi:hypothetical protein